MTVLSLLDPRGWFGGYRAKLTGGPDAAATAAALEARGRPVTADSALQVSAFWACVRLIAETIATLPLQLFRNDGAGGRSAQTSNPLYALLHDQPNADFTAIEFWEGAVAYMAVGGTAYVRKNFIGNRLVAIDLLRAPLVHARRDRNGLILYGYNDPIGGRVEYTDDQIMPLRGFGFGDICGLSALGYARRTLSIALAGDEATDAAFANGMKVSGFFKYKGGNGILTPAQREQAKKLLVDPYVGAGNAAKTGILEGDFDWIAASMSLADAQLLESRRFGVEDVCRWLGVPPILIGHSAQGQTMWGSGVEQIMLGWLAMGLRPYLVRIEQAIRKHLIAPADRGTLYAEFNVDGLLRADSKARSENYSRLAQNGIYTRNEIRALENMKSVDGGDALTVQTNLVPIDKLGELASLPRLKPVAEGADDVAASVDGFRRTLDLVDKLTKQAGEREARLVDLLAKFNPHHGPDGRFVSGDGGDETPPAKPLVSSKALIKVGGFVLSAAAVGLAVATSKGKPYRAASHLPTHDAHRAFHAASLTADLTDAEKAAIHDYTAHDFAAVNERLRLGRKPNARIDDLDASLGKASLSEDRVVFRGLNMDRSKRILRTPPGQMFLDRGYPSTTVYEPVARHFAQTVGGAPAAASKRGYVVSINVDKGANALPLHPDHVRHPDEHEVLLPRGSAFKLLRVDHDTRTIYAQHVGVVHEGAKAAPHVGGMVFFGEPDKYLWADDDLEWFEPLASDTTAADYVDYAPPQPDGTKFEPSQPRDAHGQWTGGARGNAADDETVEASRTALAHEVQQTIKATAIVAGGALAALVLPEAIAGSFLVAGALAMADGIAFDMYVRAGVEAGKHALNDMGVSTRQAEDLLHEAESLTKADAGDAAVRARLVAVLAAAADAARDAAVAELRAKRPNVPAELVAAVDAACKTYLGKLAGLAPAKRAFATVAAKSRDALIAALGGTLDDPGVPEARKAIRDAYRGLLADLDAL